MTREQALAELAEALQMDPQHLDRLFRTVAAHEHLVYVFPDLATNHPNYPPNHREVPLGDWPKA
jgi:hypothetical protein